MTNTNEFKARGQAWSEAVASDGTVLFYEESLTGSGRKQRVLVRGGWVYCPSCELMYPQETINGFARGSRVYVTDMGMVGTVLSVYQEGGYSRACVMLDDRAREHDRQGLMLSSLKHA